MQSKSIVNRLTAAAERVILSRVKSSSLFNEYYNRTEKRASYTKQATTYKRKEIKDWINGVIAATDPENPRRGMLMRVYESLMLDLHLGSCIDNRILPIQCAAYKLTDTNGVEDLEAHKLLERPWYIELVKLVCMHTYEGTKLLELFELNEKGELKEVKQIPQSNFIATKGIVIQEEYDDNGVSYKDGLYKDYYIQIGGDWSLGMLNQLASIVLAKKLGLGSWLSYIEKFGVPPIFAITERMDDGRRQELYEMLENFRMNHFAVLQGNEKIEVPNNYNVDAYNSFETLISKVANNEMSKRILGGSGISDEKSFVGSAEVQERLLKYRHQVDKLIFKYYFNEEIKPRLVKLSSVYKPLENLTFEFDETESLSLKDILEAVKALSSFYNFDVDELVKITGLPIVSIKSALGDTTPPASEKKKPSASLKSSNPQSEATPIIYSATWDAAFDRLANQVWNGEIKADQLDKDLVLKNYSAFSKEAQSAWGKGYDESPVTRRIRENLLKFSGAKAYNLIKRIEDLSKQGISKEEFERQAKNAASIHNEAWLEVEKKFVANSASSARDFESYMADADIYPYLKNRTMGDSEVRDSHAVNDGVIKPIHEWTQIPPYDPGCRCWLEQTNEPPTTHHKMQNLDEKWANNPVFSGKIFVGSHNYFASIPSESKKVTADNSEKMKVYAPYSKSMSAGGDSKVFISDFSDISDTDSNVAAAKTLAKNLKTNIYVRPHVNNIVGYKNPELGIGAPNSKADLKTFEAVRNGKPIKLDKFIVNSFKSANEQGAKSVVIDISAEKNDCKDILIRRICGGINKGINTNLKQVFVIANGKVASITRDQVSKRKFDEFLKDLD
jgi:Protein of unknown function (DUF935)./Phage Mu protein F like protein.